MRFLIITDLHENASAVEWINGLAKKYDVPVLFLGDVVDEGELDKALDILKKFDCDVYYIPGNCDPRDLPEKAKDIVNVVHGKAFELGGVKIAAFGGSNPIFGTTPFEVPEDEILAALEPISSEGMLLMTHAPSKDTLDTIPAGINVGSTAIRQILDRYHPIAAISGHIHESAGMKTVNGTLCINPGPAKEGHAVLLEIENGKVSAKGVGPSD